MPGKVGAGGNTRSVQPPACLRSSQSSRHPAIGCTASAAALPSRFTLNEAGHTTPWLHCVHSGALPAAPPCRLTQVCPACAPGLVRSCRPLLGMLAGTAAQREAFTRITALFIRLASVSGRPCGSTRASASSARSAAVAACAPPGAWRARSKATADQTLARRICRRFFSTGGRPGASAWSSRLALSSWRWMRCSTPSAGSSHAGSVRASAAAAVRVETCSSRLATSASAGSSPPVISSKNAPAACW